MVLRDKEPDVGEDFLLTDAGLLLIILARRRGVSFELHISCSQYTQAALDDGRDTSQSCHFLKKILFPLL